MSNSVMEVVDVEQGTQEWLDWRKTGVTATCSPILVGDSSATKTPYQLYLQYVGLIEPDDLSHIKQVRAGNVCEPLARAWAEKRYGQLGLPLCVKHKDYPYMIASLDGHFADGSILEIKNISESKHLNIIKDGIHAPDFMYYYWQVQHQLFVTGAPFAYLLFWSAKDEPKVFRITPQPKSQKKVFDVCTAFWEQVNTKKSPAFDKEKDVLLISDSEIISQTDGFNIPSDIEDRMRSIRNQANALSKAKAEVDRLEKLSKASIAGLADSLGFQEDDNVRIDGYGIRYLETKIKGSVNWKNLAHKLIPDLNPADHPDCLNKEKKTQKLSTYEYMSSDNDSAEFNSISTPLNTGGISDEFIVDPNAIQVF